MRLTLKHMKNIEKMVLLSLIPLALISCATVKKTSPCNPPVAIIEVR